MSELTHDATSRTLETERGTLHYHEAGDGPPLLLLHGSGPGVSGWANFRGNLPVFAEHFRTLVLDLPGFGKSYSCEQSPMMAAPQAVLDFLDGMSLDSLPIVGNSMGGNVGGTHRREQPRPGRAGSSRSAASGWRCSARRRPKASSSSCSSSRTRPASAWSRGWSRWSTTPSILTDEFVELRWEAANNPAALDDVRRMFNSKILKAMRRRNPMVGEQVGMLAKIEAPTLITYGRDDRVTPLDSVLVPMRVIPQVRGAHLPGLRSLGDDRTQARVRRRRPVVPVCGDRSADVR